MYRRNNAPLKYSRKAPARRAAPRRAPMRSRYSRPQYVEPTAKEVVTTYTANTGAASKIALTMKVTPDVDVLGNAAPLWSTISSRYDEYRVTMFTADIILEQSDRPAFSVIDRSNAEMADPTNFVKDRNHKLHTVSSDSKKVTIMWKPNSPSDDDWHSTSNPQAYTPAYIHFLQHGLTNATPIAEVRTKAYIQCRGQKN